MSDRSLRRPPPVVAQAAEAAVGTISPRELLAEHFGGGPACIVADGRRTLVARGVHFATVGPDPAMITPVCAVSARELPVVDVLAALASQDPSGVLVIETTSDAFAFEVSRGRLTGARGVGPLDQLEPFVAEVHRRHPQRFGVDAEIDRDQPAWMKVARTFVEERVLDQLTLGRIPGTRMTLIRGDVEWLGTRLPADVGPTLAHVLLEHARRFDELPKLLDTLGDLARVAIPLAEPGERPQHRAPGTAEHDWDFFADPDPAAIGEWNDAIAVWALCDGESSLDEIIEGAMIGRFRGMLALRTLASARCIVLIDPRIPALRTDPPAEPHGEVTALHLAPEPEAPVSASVTGYSIVARAAPKRSRRETTSVAPPPPPPAVLLDPVTPSPLFMSSTEAAAVVGNIEIETPVATPRAARSMVAARALDDVLPSPKTVMFVLGAAGLVAVAASIVAMV